MYFSDSHLAIDIGYLFFDLELNLLVVVLKEIIVFLTCVCIKTTLFPKFCELNTQALENLFIKHKMQLGI